MKPEIRLQIQANRLLGEYIGTLEGIMKWNIPQELKDSLKEQLKQLRKMEIIDIIPPENEPT